MKSKYIRFISGIFAAYFILCTCSVNAIALNFNGTASGGGDGSSTTASSGGYAVPNMIVNNSNRAVGYRFTIINDAGITQRTPIDIFRYNSYLSDRIFFAGYYKFDNKYSKIYLKNNYSWMSFSTSGTTDSVCHDCDLGLTLPNDTTGLPGWCNDYNIGTVIQALWSINVAMLESNGWAVLIEPIFPVKIQGIYHSLTVTEIAVYGASKFGSGSNGNSSGNSNSWGFIANYTNRYLPNSLRLTSSYCGMSAAGYLSGRTTFANIISNGYGAAIAYADYLERLPSITRWTYYQDSYDGFYVYVQTERAARLLIPTWTANNGQDDLIWHEATAQNNTVRGQTYNWAMYVPRSSHNYELGCYITHFYAYTAGGKSVSSGDSYEPPKVTNVTVRQTDAGGFNVYARTQAANKLSVPIWTENGGQDDLLWYPAQSENNTIDGISYNWRVYVPLSDHNNELGKYIIHFYVANAYSTDLYATQTTFTPKALAQLKVKCCEVYKAPVFDHGDNLLGTSYGDGFEAYEYKSGYPMMGDDIWLSINFPAETEDCYVEQTVCIEGIDTFVRTGYLNNSEWYDIVFRNRTVDENRSYYVVKARSDLLNNDGSVKTKGEEYTFYIPVCPTVHRYQVAAKSITEDLQAYVNEGGNVGSVYVGQRICPEYTFKTDNTWTSYNDLSATRYEWNNSFWDYAYHNVSMDNADVNVKKAAISKNMPYKAEGHSGFYTVPDNSGSGKNILLFELCSNWASDTEHTGEVGHFEIPIVKADIEITNIRLIDENGYYLDPSNLEAGQQVTVQYTYRNNTSCTVYVNGYDRRHEQIKGIYAITARQVINVIGGYLTVPNVRQFSIWGGVYLESVGLGNTQYEINGDNNERMLECKVNMPLHLSAITPNAEYRDGTDVITSYWITNSSDYNYTPDSNISVRFVILNFTGNMIETKEVKNVIVPAKDKNICYFKWHVPNGLNSKSVIIQAMIVENGNYYNNISGSYKTIPYTVYSTPDTKFERTAPSGFTVPAVPTETSGNAIWWEYIYKNNNFKKNYYAIGIYNAYTKEITPATGSTAVKNGSDRTMKSGYGFGIKIHRCLAQITGYALPSSSAYTGIQYAYATFPEYNYSNADSKIRTLMLIENGAHWGFHQNGSYGNVHYTPLWYPDGGYTVKVTKSDCWTPAGMLTASVVTNTITINGSIYDDHYIGRK